MHAPALDRNVRSVRWRCPERPGSLRTDQGVENDVLPRIGFHPSNLAGSMKRLQMCHAPQDAVLYCMIGLQRYPPGVPDI